MTVVNSVTGRVLPGRYEDFLSQGLEVSKLFERHGARDIRLLEAVAAGEASNSWAFSAEFDDAEAYGSFSDELASDVEMQSIVARVRAADSPVVIEQQSLLAEIPLDRKGKARRGNVVEVHTSRVTPGRFEQALETAKTALNFVERHGGRHGRLFQLGYAGVGSGLLLLSWEFENMRAQGKASGAWQTDPKGQALGSLMYSADSPTTLVFSGLFMRIPL
jgi:hypothetical protein